MTDQPTCPLPGCPNPTAQVGTPCKECFEAFGDYLAPAPPREVPVSAEEITAKLEERDRGIAAAYAMQAATEIASTTNDPSAYKAAVQLLANPGAGQIGERKLNQRCWCCEERHTCTREQLGWACDACREIS